MAEFPTTLLSGYQAFRAGGYHVEKERFHELAEKGQKPAVMLIACCDSRSAPETIFNASPGELFVVRNVANLVPVYGPDEGFYSLSAALEFAVQALKVKHIVVMGHARCGGISAALNLEMEPLSSANFIGKWMDRLRPEAQTVLEDDTIDASEKQVALERISVRSSVENLRSFPFVADLEAQGKLSLHGSWFDISTGELWTLNADSEEFEQAPEES